MENKCNKSDLFLIVKRRNISRFKAGAELSGKVNKIHVDVNQHETEDAQAIELKPVFFDEVCEKTKPGNCK